MQKRIPHFIYVLPTLLFIVAGIFVITYQFQKEQTRQKQDSEKLSTANLDLQAKNTSDSKTSLEKH